MERTLAIIVFVLLLVGLGHMYYNNSLKEGMDGIAPKQCGAPLDGDDYASLKKKIHNHIDRKHPERARAMKKAEHMIHTYSKAIDLYYKYDGDRRKTLSKGREIGLFNKGQMGVNEFKFIRSLAKSLEARVQ